MANYSIYYGSLFILILYCITNISKGHVISELDTCKLNGSSTWTCNKKSNCQWTKEDNSKNQNIKCGVERETGEEKICCPYKSSTKPTINVTKGALQVEPSINTTKSTFQTKPSINTTKDTFQTNASINTTKSEFQIETSSNATQDLFPIDPSVNSTQGKFQTNAFINATDDAFIIQSSNITEDAFQTNHFIRATNDTVQIEQFNNETKDVFHILMNKCNEYAAYSKLDCPQTGHIRRKRILGGEAVKEKEYPHMALIGYGDTNGNDIMNVVGGSLISEDFILSSAHATEILSLRTEDTIWATMGVVSKENITSDSRGINLFKIVKIIKHPEYGKDEDDFGHYDIALYKLENPVKFSPSMRPICLYNDQIQISNIQEATATGWGTTDVDDCMTDLMQKTTLDLIDSKLCEEKFSGEVILKNGFDTNTMICAVDFSGGKDVCHGDGGGPLQVPIPEMPCMWLQIGITSHGSPTCGDHTPEMFTKISYYLPWIQKTVWP